MNALTIAADAIPALGHEEAMRLAAAEYDRLLDLVDDLHDEDWSRPTDCTDWDVKATLGHLLGMLELQADAEERMRQVKTAAEIAARTGRLRIDEMTALQVREHTQLAPEELRRALHDAAAQGLASRQALTADERARPYLSELPGEKPWTLGYLFDVIHTRDPWMHRIDIARATGRELVLSADHDGRLVADVLSDWASRHGQWFTLTLTGAAGGSYHTGDAIPGLELDAIEFCRILSGRAQQPVGLPQAAVPF
jgi:uncharacterized protein (TIGR03083 family)